MTYRSILRDRISTLTRLQRTRNTRDRYYNYRVETFEAYFVDVYDFLEDYYYYELDLDRDLAYCDSASLYLNNYDFNYNFFYDIKS